MELDEGALAEITGGDDGDGGCGDGGSCGDSSSSSSSNDSSNDSQAGYEAGFATLDASNVSRMDGYSYDVDPGFSAPSGYEYSDGGA